MSRGEMIERFRASGEAVLFGTRSFWEGIDIPGEALSLVILDRIPFVPPGDPVLERLKQIISAKGGNWFRELQVVPAVTVLRQGSGRLIRTETDRGVIAILDSRINTHLSYGPTILRSLPNGRHTLRFEEVRKFFAE